MLHKFILWIFDTLINIEKFLRVVCLFFIMFLALYWIQNLIGTTWWWMAFLAPFFELVLDFVNNIYSVSFDFWGKSFEIKYFNALVLILLVIFGLKLIDMGLEFLKDLYDDAYRAFKKANEKAMNYSMKKAIDSQEKLAAKYMLFIQTKIPQKYLSRAIHVDIDEQNKMMNDFITKQTSVKPIETWNGFLYYFDNFENVDQIIEIVYRIIGSPAPLMYAACIQIGNETNKIKQLADLQNWGKIIMSADTLYRYNLNYSHKYETSNIGIFQKDDGTLEVHEFNNDL